MSITHKDLIELRRLHRQVRGEEDTGKGRQRQQASDVASIHSTCRISKGQHVPKLSPSNQISSHTANATAAALAAVATHGAVLSMRTNSQKGAGPHKMMASSTIDPNAQRSRHTSRLRPLPSHACSHTSAHPSVSRTGNTMSGAATAYEGSNTTTTTTTTTTTYGTVAGWCEKYTDGRVAADLAPKLMVPARQLRGELSREEMLRRRRALFDSYPPLTNLIVACGVPADGGWRADAVGSFHTLLPLQAFDDVDRYEAYSRTDWLQQQQQLCVTDKPCSNAFGEAESDETAATTTAAGLLSTPLPEADCVEAAVSLSRTDGAPGLTQSSASGSPHSGAVNAVPMQTTGTGAMDGLRCTFLRMSADGSGAWVSGRVVDWSEETDLLTVIPATHARRTDEDDTNSTDSNKHAQPTPSRQEAGMRDGAPNAPETHALSRHENIRVSGRDAARYTPKYTHMSPASSDATLSFATTPSSTRTHTDETRYVRQTCVEVPRVYVCLAAENPFHFAQRFAAAYLRRRRAEDIIRTRLYAQAVPMDEFQLLDTTVETRVRMSAMNTPRLMQASSNLDVATVMGEVRAGYDAVMHMDLLRHYYYPPAGHVESDFNECDISTCTQRNERARCATLDTPRSLSGGSHSTCGVPCSAPRLGASSRRVSNARLVLNRSLANEPVYEDVLYSRHNSNQNSAVTLDAGANGVLDFHEWRQQEDDADALRGSDADKRSTLIAERAAPLYGIDPQVVPRYARVVEAFRSRTFFGTGESANRPYDCISSSSRDGHQHSNRRADRDVSVLRLYQAIQQLHSSILTTQIFLFDADIEAERPLTPQVFEDVQTSAVRSAAQHIRESWYSSIADTIKTHLQRREDSSARTISSTHGANISCHTIHLQYYTEESYRGSLTHRFFTTVGLAMEDVLRHVLMANVEAFTRFIEDAGNFTVTVESMHDVRVVAGSAVHGHAAPFGLDSRVTDFYLRRTAHPLEPLFTVTLLDDPQHDPPHHSVLSRRQSSRSFSYSTEKCAGGGHAGDGQNTSGTAYNTSLTPSLHAGNPTDVRTEKGRHAHEREKHNEEEQEQEQEQPPPKSADASNGAAGRVIDYSCSADTMRSIVRTLFRRCLADYAELRTMEHTLFDFVYHSRTCFLCTMTMEERFVQSCLARIDAVFDRVAASMASYLDTFVSFHDLATLRLTSYRAHFEATFPTTEGVELELRHFLDKQQHVRQCIPVEVDMGLVRVDCRDLRRRLSTRCMQVCAAILDIMALRAVDLEGDIDRQFTELHRTLMQPTDSAEQVVATRDFIQSLPESVQELRQRIAHALDIHDLLERYQRALTEEEFEKKWRAVSWPMLLDDQITNRLHSLEETERYLIASMQQRQRGLEQAVVEMQDVVSHYAQYNNMHRLREIAADVRRTLEGIESLRAQANAFNNDERLLKLPRTDYTSVHQLPAQFEPYASLWLAVEEWTVAQEQWRQGVFSEMDATAVAETCRRTRRAMQQAIRNSWDAHTRLTPELIRIAEGTRQAMDGFAPLVPVIGYLRTPGMKARHWAQLSKEVGFEVNPDTTLTRLDQVHSLHLCDHSDTLARIADVAAQEYHLETTLSAMRAVWEQEEVTCMSVQAYRQTGCFILAKDTVDKLQETLDDQMLTTQALSFSPFRQLFESELVAWEASLRTVQEVLEAWVACQKSWLYLQPIFLSNDIARQLPSEHRRFQQVNKTWTVLTRRAHEVDRMMTFSLDADEHPAESCLERLRGNNVLLEQVERGLNQYLENKRVAFARFYFLSDDELLTILSAAHDPRQIQPHFGKLFENMARVRMDGEDHEMLGMYSAMEEYVPFAPRSILPRKSVESWLSELESTMKTSVRAALERGLRDFHNQSHEVFVLQAVGQVGLAVHQILWTEHCEAALREHGSLAPYAPQVMQQLSSLVDVVRKPLSPRERMNLSGLITLQVHARDVVEQLVKNEVDSVDAFDWIAQLRSYWEGNDCVLRQVEAQFIYGGEYLGNTGRLVITPLTDRIYLTLTGAMHMFLGGAPAGPAGTGKTETVKDLAKALAKQCVVFNCQEGMTYGSMGKFFKGLAQAGAWACFDEFNRIDVEVLSVVAQQVSALQNAGRTRQYRIPFEGSEIVVDPTHAVFITMNPGYAGRTELPDNLKVLFRPVACMVPDYAMIGEIRLFSYGYKKARLLAHKMVVTFRLSSEQLSSQDHYDFGMRAVNTVIAAAGQMKRHSESAEVSEEVLLLRALRDSNVPKFLHDDVLLFDGIVRDLFPGIALPEREWDDGFVPALREAAVARQLQPTQVFIHKCVQLYEMSLLRHGQMTVGPTMGGKTCATRVLQAALTAMAKQQQQQQQQREKQEEQPQHDERHKGKQQLHVPSRADSKQQLPSQSPKNSALRPPAEKLSAFSEVKTYAINPKAVTMSQLYGGFDDVTGEWRDGLVGQLFRTAAQDRSPAQQWIIFDGPVDALWIESMNTVLDDNKKLCLISGEIIVMTPAMHCLFEVEDLAVASPATVSRAGMIYMEPDSCVGLGSLVRSWQMYQLPSAMTPHQAALQELCENLFPPLLRCVRTEVVEYTASVWPNLVLSCFNLYNALLRPFTQSATTETARSDANTKIRLASATPPPPAAAVAATTRAATTSATSTNDNDTPTPLPTAGVLGDVYVPLLVCAVAWSLGATGDRASQQRFDACLREELKNLEIDVGLPLLGCVSDYEFVVDEQRWIAWSDRLPDFTTAVTRSNMPELIVPTADVMRYTFVIQRLLENHCHTLCCGPTGTGKTVLLQRLLMQEMAKKPHDILPTVAGGGASGSNSSSYCFTPVFFTFSARTSANQTQDLLVSKLEVRRRATPQVWGAPVKTKLVFVMDDMNMPMQEVYGAQPPMELLRQWLDYGGWYDRCSREFFHVVDVTLVGAMGPAGGGRHRVTPRLVRHFHQLAFAEMEDDSMRQIFATLLSRCFVHTSEAVRSRVTALVLASMEVYHEVAGAMRPRPTSPHYLFNLRDLAQVMQGVASAATATAIHRSDGNTSEVQGMTSEAVALLRLWLHEEMRTFGDRLVCAADVNWFESLLRTQLEKHFRVSYDDVLLPLQHARGDSSGRGSLYKPNATRRNEKKDAMHNNNDDDDTSPSAGGALVSSASELLFASFLSVQENDSEGEATAAVAAESTEDGGVYTEVFDFDHLVRTLNAKLAAYNTECVGHELNLVMFGDAVRHVCRIARVLRKSSGGHVLLLGLGGSGRQSLSRLAAYIYDYDVSQVEITKGYTMATWHEDLKTVLRGVGLKNHKVLFLFTDTQIVHEAMLEDVNSLLNSGEVPNLFVGQELDDILLSMKSICVRENVPLDKVSLYARFVKACRAHLHIAVCMSPLGEVFRSRLRMFPALVNCCTIDWFAAWPHQALWDVAHNYFSTVPLLQTLSSEHAQSTRTEQHNRSVEPEQPPPPSSSSSSQTLSSSQQPQFGPSQPELVTAPTKEPQRDAVLVCTEMCVYMHESVELMSGRLLREAKRHNYVTATSFLELLHTFRRLLESQTERHTTTRQRLENGLAKLKETEESVAVLRRTLAESQPVLHEKSESVRGLMEEIQSQTAAAELTKGEAQREREVVARNQAECAAIEQEAQSQLAEALPELDRALESLKNLKSSQITEVAGYKAPTSGVVMTMQGMCILFQIRPLMRAAGPMDEKKPDYWTTAREQLLGNPNQLLQRLIQYDKEHIPERLIQAVMPLVLSDDFTPKKIATASQACAAMCQWTHAMVRFHGVNRMVAPLRDRLSIAQEANRLAMGKLAVAEERLRAVAAALQALHHRKDAADADMHTLEERVKMTELKLTRAAQLIHGLADEKQNWTAQVHTLRQTARRMLGDMLIAAGQIAYVGPFTAPFRAALLRQWSAALQHRFAVTHTTAPSPSLTVTLYNAVQAREWAAHGLPLDTVSMENALILSHARLWPLLIDPQAQANRWIRRSYAESLEVLTMHTRDVMKRIEYCIRAGRPVLLENLGEEIDPCLTPLLARQIFVQGGTEMIRLGETVIPWNAKFRLFLTTTLPNPHYTPEVMVRVTLLNFLITPHGLEDQLLGVVVGQERKELEQRRGELVHRNATARADLATIQRTILCKLDAVRGDILDDVELIDYLAESKKTTREMNVEVVEAEAAEREIDASREVYRGIAAHSASLYFCAAALSTIDPMYQYSLPWFVQLFVSSIHQATRSEDVTLRLSHLREHVTYAFYTNVSRSLFEKHKLMFSFFLCLTILTAEDRVVESELRFVLQGPLLLDAGADGAARGASTAHAKARSCTHASKRNQPAATSPHCTRRDDSGSSGSSSSSGEPNRPRECRHSARTGEGEDDEEGTASGAWDSECAGRAAGATAAPRWMTDLIWAELDYLDRHVPVFAGVLRHMCDDSSEQSVAHYRDMFHSAAAHRQPMASSWTRPLSAMQRMMFLRCVRPDKLMEAVQDFVAAELGERFIRPPPFNLLTSFLDSCATTPLIFILSQGADPYEDWRRFAESQQMSKRLYDISLGQGQGPRAERMLQDGAENGMWVLLQNCHLAISWMPTLERVVDALTPATTHPNFRLWLTSMPSAGFPVSLLQNGVKMTNEPPKGMQANVSRSLLSYSDDFFTTCRRPKSLRKLVFSMAFFHALVQERRKFGPLGWNIPYEYTAGDLSCCVTQMKMFVDKYAEVPYRVIRELSGNIHYGGRVTDDWDRRTLNTLLETFMRPEVMQDDYPFSSLPTYCSVAAQNQQGYLDYVASWPMNTLPETFGLHENADIACALSETQETLTAIVLLRSEAAVGRDPRRSDAVSRPRRRRRSQPTRQGTRDGMTSKDDGSSEDGDDEGMRIGEGATASMTRSSDEVVLALARAIDARIATPFNLNHVRERFPTRYADSMNTVVVQEAIRYNRVIEVVHGTLDSLPLAIQGDIVMTKELEEMYQSMYNNQVPALWAQCAYPSLKPLASWVDDLVMRLRMIQRWYTDGHPRAYWISGFFFPQAFLTGILQNFARTMQISIDAISYDFEWTNVEPEKLESGPSKGCYVYGMYMEGARIDRRTFMLTESRPKILFETTPVLWLKPAVQRIKPDRQTVYECPLYKTVLRAGTLSTTGHSTNYVLTAEIGSTVDPKHWVRRGVAMVCALSS